jgi:hypothetical protein
MLQLYKLNPAHGENLTQIAQQAMSMAFVESRGGTVYLKRPCQ